MTKREIQLNGDGKWRLIRRWKLKTKQRKSVEYFWSTPELFRTLLWRTRNDKAGVSYELKHYGSGHNIYPNMLDLIKLLIEDLKTDERMYSTEKDWCPMKGDAK